MKFEKNLKIRNISKVILMSNVGLDIFIYYGICFFLVGTCIIMLLQTDMLPEPEQRLAAVTILHELYRGQSFTNTPFANVFIHLLVSILYIKVKFSDQPIIYISFSMELELDKDKICVIIIIIY